MSRIAYAFHVLVALVISLVLAGCQTEYQEGYEKGAKDVREFRQSAGLAGELTIQAADKVGQYPTDTSKSADWNSGYRAGAHAEIQK